MTKTSLSDDPKATPIERGKRVKNVRLFAGLTQTALEDKYDISVNTQQGWEKGKRGGLTPKGAMRIMYAMRQEGVYVTKEYLLYGIGIGPQRLEDIVHTGIDVEQALDTDEETAIHNELITFRKYNHNAIDMRVIDDAMSPQYMLGEYVGGQRLFNDDIVKCVNYDCIVETVAGEFLFRRLKSGNKPGVYTLYCLNPNANVPEPVLYNVELKSAAPVIWLRRKRQV